MNGPKAAFHMLHCCWLPRSVVARTASSVNCMQTWSADERPGVVGENSTINLFIEKILTNNQSSIVLSNLTTKRYMMQQLQPAWCHQSTCFEAFFHYKSKQMIWAVSCVVHYNSAISFISCLITMLMNIIGNTFVIWYTVALHLLQKL